MKLIFIFSESALNNLSNHLNKDDILIIFDYYIYIKAKKLYSNTIETFSNIEKKFKINDVYKKTIEIKELSVNLSNLFYKELSYRKINILEIIYYEIFYNILIPLHKLTYFLTYINKKYSKIDKIIIDKNIPFSNSYIYKKKYLLKILKKVYKKKTIEIISYNNTIFDKLLYEKENIESKKEKKIDPKYTIKSFIKLFNNKKNILLLDRNVNSNKILKLFELENQYNIIEFEKIRDLVTLNITTNKHKKFKKKFFYFFNKLFKKTTTFNIVNINFSNIAKSYLKEHLEKNFFKYLKLIDFSYLILKKIDHIIVSNNVIPENIIVYKVSEKLKIKSSHIPDGFNVGVYIQNAFADRIYTWSDNEFYLVKKSKAHLKKVSGYFYDQLFNPKIDIYNKNKFKFCIILNTYIPSFLTVTNFSIDQNYIDIINSIDKKYIDELCIKPHPSVQYEKVINYQKFLINKLCNKSVKIIEKSERIENVIKKYDIFIGNFTNAAFDIATYGKIFILYLNFICYNFKDFFTEKSCFKKIKEPENINKYIELIKKDSKSFFKVTENIEKYLGKYDKNNVLYVYKDILNRIEKG